MATTDAMRDCEDVTNTRALQMIFTTKTILILLIIQMIALLAYNFSGMCVTGLSLSLHERFRVSPFLQYRPIIS